MKYRIEQWLNKRLYLLLVAIGLFTLAFVLNHYIIGPVSAYHYAHRIEERIQQKEQDFYQLSIDTELVGKLIDHRFTEAELEHLMGQDYCVFLYELPDDTLPGTLLFWNSQLALPSPALVGDRQPLEKSRLVTLENGLYVYVNRPVTFRPGRQLFLKALIPVKWKYIVETEHLQKEFVAFEGAIRHVDIASARTEFPVNSFNGNVLFYLQNTYPNKQQSSVLVIVVMLTGFFFLFLFLHQVAHRLAEQRGLWYGVAFLSGILVLLRLLTYLFPRLLALRQFELFDPAIYGSSYVLSSLGDLLINAVLFCWIVVFISRRFTIDSVRLRRQVWQNWLLLVAVLAGLVVITFTLADILQSLVSDAQISFNVTNFFSLSQYSFIGFVVLGILALTYFFLSKILLSVAALLAGPYKYVGFIIIAFIGLLIQSFTSNTSAVELNLYVLLWLLLYTWLMQQQVFSGLNSRLNLSEVLFWLFVFSFFMSAVIIFENRKIESEQQRRFADRLASQYNQASESLLSVTLAYLDSNFLRSNFPRFTEAATNEYLKDSIVKHSLGIYLSRYDTRIYTFDSLGHPLFNAYTGSYDTLNTIYRQAKETGGTIPGLRYYEKSYDKIAYIFRREIYDSVSQKIGSLFVLSETKDYKPGALTPELFKTTREKVPEYSPVYSYAFYDTTTLKQHYNDYAFPTELQADQLPRRDSLVKKADGYEELWVQPAPGKIVAIARRSNYFLEAITLFAYLFSTFLFLLSFYRFVSILVRTRLRWSSLKQYWQMSIRSQIHSTIILVSLLSFVVIGITIILFFINRYDRDNTEKLTRTMKLMVAQVEDKFHNSIFLYDPLYDEDVERMLQELSQVHGMDVNLYNTRGKLLFTSNRDWDIYSAGLLSTRMNPLAFYRLATLHQVQSVMEERVGKINYLSIYAPVRDEHADVVAYLNIPSYSAQMELKQEISNLLVTIINLNAFIFLVAGAIALFVTNRITSSFTLIGEKMRDMNLGKMNQQIEWKRDDEIGVLVTEYNKMVTKLDESAQALAKSEREGAWRQMARQVAHEIKNPLTPMKLSIQYLQKAIDNNTGDVKQMTASVARTLIEQIDHLSKIASDFSQFANIGNPKKEVFDLHEMLGSLSSLYISTENLNFHWEPVQNRVLVFADKTQLNRLFTNLLQNAIEASDNRDDRVIRMNEQLEGENIIVSITDNGGGIPEATREKIFIPNFTTKSSGTGLGLAMSKSIVEQAKGELWFQTTDGVGTTFYVKLPLLRATT